MKQETPMTPSRVLDRLSQALLNASLVLNTCKNSEIKDALFVWHIWDDALDLYMEHIKKEFANAK